MEPEIHTSGIEGTAGAYLSMIALSQRGVHGCILPLVPLIPCLYI